MSERYVTEETVDTFGWPCDRDDFTIEQWRDEVYSVGELTDWDLHQLFDEYLDGVYGDIEIAGFTHSTSRALKAVSDIDYQCEFNDWLDAERKGGHIVDVDEVER